MLELLGFKFFQNALIVGFLAAVACGIIGTYIQIKKMSLITGSIAHTAFGGLGISYFFNLNPLMGATAFSVISAGLIGYFRKEAKEHLDTILSSMWATGMAIGLIFIFLTPGYSADLFTYLFGNILLVSDMELIALLILDAIVISAAFLLYNPIKLVLFDEDYAETRNIPTQIIYTILFVMIALTIITLIRVVGIVLIIALLTMPAAAAQLLSRKMETMMVMAGAITLISIIGGLTISHFAGMPTGPIIVLLSAAIYIGTNTITNKKNSKK